MEQKPQRGVGSASELLKGDSERRMAAPTEVLEWRQARQWLINSEVIPPTHRVTKPDVDLVDFARSLRDGVFLCSLVNKLKPNCVEDWSPKPLMQVWRENEGARAEKECVVCLLWDVKRWILWW